MSTPAASAIRIRVFVEAAGSTVMLWCHMRMSSVLGTDGGLRLRVPSEPAPQIVVPGELRTGAIKDQVTGLQHNGPVNDP
jgi:hypothetical protein